MTGELYQHSSDAQNLNKATSGSDYAEFMSESPPFLEEIPGRNKATSGSDYAEFMSESPPFLEEIPGRNKATSGSYYAEFMLLESNEFTNILSVCRAQSPQTEVFFYACQKLHGILFALFINRLHFRISYV
jgi:hypothetical protein